MSDRPSHHDPITPIETVERLPQHPPVERSRPRAIALAPRMTTSTAFLVIARACGAELGQNLARARADIGSERIHQLRVAVRRSRAAISIFGGVVAKERRRPMADRLRGFQHDLAAAREWDVFLQQDLFARARDKEAGKLREQAVNLQKDGYRRAVAAVADPAIVDLPHAFDRWIAGEATLAPPIADTAWDPSLPIADYAIMTLNKLRRRICKLGGHLESFDEARLHELRIHVKKLHYASDFFSSLWEGSAARHYVQAVKTLQDALGNANDFAVARQLLTRLGGDTNEGAAAMRELQVRTVWRQAPVLCRIVDLVGEFAHLRPFWKELE